MNNKKVVTMTRVSTERAMAYLRVSPLELERTRALIIKKYFITGFRD